MDHLTRYEEILLISILQLETETYGINIQDHIQKITGKKWNYGTLYRMLNQLVKKGLLDRREGDPLPQKGGRRKKYYTLTPRAVETMHQIQELQKTLWNNRTEFALEQAGRK